MLKTNNPTLILAQSMVPAAATISEVLAKTAFKLSSRILSAR